MCRWLAYRGSPITIDKLVTKPDHSLVDQSINARRLVVRNYRWAEMFPGDRFPTNGEGFGLAFVGQEGKIGLFREILPAWNSHNLQSLAPQIETTALLAHVRAAPAGTVSQENCHPFVHDGWMFQHNGTVGDFEKLKRDLQMDVAPELFPFIQGNMDTETCFYLALTYGLDQDPVGAMLRMNERVEAARLASGVTAPFGATMCASDGKRMVTMRVSSREGLGDRPVPESPSLFEARGPVRLRMADGSEEVLPEDTLLICSEPLELDFSEETWKPMPDRTITFYPEVGEPTHTQIPL